LIFYGAHMRAALQSLRSCLGGPESCIEVAFGTVEKADKTLRGLP
jgi:hypothetical protein